MIRKIIDYFDLIISDYMGKHGWTAINHVDNSNGSFKKLLDEKGIKVRRVHFLSREENSERFIVVGLIKDSQVKEYSKCLLTHVRNCRICNDTESLEMYYELVDMGLLCEEVLA